MARAIIISHPSEIVRKGLLAIFENEIVARIICTTDLSEIKDNYFVTFSEMILIIPREFNQSDLLFNFRSKRNQLLLIGIETINDSKTDNNQFDYTFHLNSTSVDLLKQVNRFFSSDNLSKQNDELTTREKEVLRLIALGHTNKSIADILFISPHTVISHRKNITEKLGIKSIPGLTVYAIIQKIISQTDIANNELS